MKKKLLLLSKCAAIYVAVFYIFSFSNVNAEGLVGYWKFDEGEGTAVYDSAGDHNGVNTGAEWTSERWTFLGRTM